MVGDETSRRRGGRSARVRSAVYEAVGELLERGERETMSIPQVAELAGVNPTSVYRRWGSMAGLLEEVAVVVLTADASLPDTGALQTDLDLWARSIAEDLLTTTRRAYLRSMAWARTDVVDECPRWEIRRRQVEAMIARAVDRGEAAPSVRQVLDHVVAPLYHHGVFGLPVTADWAGLLVDDVMAMSAPR